MERVEKTVNMGRTPWGLWWSLAAGFLAFGLDMGFSYVLEQHSCSTGHHYVLHVTSLVCLCIALSGFGTGFFEFRQFPYKSKEEGGSPLDRAHFQALMGMAFSLAFAVGVIAVSVPRWILSPCE